MLFLHKLCLFAFLFLQIFTKFFILLLKFYLFLLYYLTFNLKLLIALLKILNPSFELLISACLTRLRAGKLRLLQLLLLRRLVTHLLVLLLHQFKLILNIPLHYLILLSHLLVSLVDPALSLLHHLVKLFSQLRHRSLLQLFEPALLGLQLLLSESQLPRL